ncbi:OLC1v1002024C1 [Oldenlandia corymbosa var. corymbosa]|uniref:Nicotianamine synthase n=1 Tax=Oldenlandia corymbosa var. corymbosa TaxID=529605 RepID=A0AAV1D6N3_OLDCO|nr:OLC1v1002024C1 [Oldenlandia corymbosa var. corymbosa]
MVCQKDALVQTISELYDQISSLESLRPSKDVDMLFTQLVLTCIPPNPIDVTKLCNKIQEMRSKLIKLCGVAEGLLEMHYSTILGNSFGGVDGENPLDHLTIFPYYNNYLKLSLLEFNILSQHITNIPNRVAFLGSGPLPLTSIVLAKNHLTQTSFHNYDIDPMANAMASKLVASDCDLSRRMFFHTRDVLDVTCEFKDFDVVFLAALVGMDKEAKLGFIEHLAKNMSPGAILMLRSAHGARGFLYPIVDPCDLKGFEVLSVFHPTDEVINSVVIARKLPDMATLMPLMPSSNNIHCGGNHVILPCKCADLQGFNPLSKLNMIEELAADDRLV